jgi:RNA polymerase sigma-70 factor (ECF subfamily)
MKASPDTRPSLLLQIRDASDREAWNQFVEIYGPLIRDYGRRRGLQDADAADLAQDVLVAIANSADRFNYDPRMGSFRGWLLTITRNKFCTLVQKAKRQGRGHGDARVDQLLRNEPSRNDDEALWDRQYQWRLVGWASEQVRSGFADNTWQAFVKTVLEQSPPAQVARQLDMSVGAVYIAKSRVLAKVKEVISRVE